VHDSPASAIAGSRGRGTSGRQSCSRVPPFTGHLLVFVCWCGKGRAAGGMQTPRVPIVNSELRNLGRELTSGARWRWS
jgi:hypothetical protein